MNLYTKHPRESSDKLKSMFDQAAFRKAKTIEDHSRMNKKSSKNESFLI